MVLVAFDAEPRGDKAAKWWLDRLETAHRLRPWWKDANQMLQDGVDLLNDWILPSIQLIKDATETVLPAEILGQDERDRCFSCGCPFPSFEGWDPAQIPDGDFIGVDPVEGEMYCEKCRPDLFEQMRKLVV